MHPTIKHMALLLYLNGLGFRRIADILGVSHVSVQNWWRQLGKDFREPEAPDKETYELVEIDELWHWHSKKNAKYGFGLLWIEPADASSLGNWVLVGKKH